MAAQAVSLSELSKRTRIAERQIMRYRKGQVVPRDHFGRPSDNALRIAQALKVDVDELFPPRERLAA